MYKKIKFILITVFALISLFFVSSNVDGATILFPHSGGTGKGRATAGDVGKFLKVSDDSPFTYTFGTALTDAISSPLGTINVSGSEIDVNTNHFFTWTADHLYSGDIEQIHSSITDLGGGINLQNIDSEFRPYLRWSNSANTSFIGFVAPNFEASQPAFYWTLPEQDASGVWQSDGAGNLSISQVVLSTQVVGVLPYANGGTNSSTAFTAGSVIFAGATGFTQDNTNFRWDNTNKRLGVGVTPSYKLHVSGGDSITGYFTSSAASTRLGVNNAVNTGFGFYVGDALKFSFASVNGGGAGANPDVVLYNDQTATNAIWVDGNNNNVSFGEIAPSTTNKFNVASTYSTSASRIAYFNGASGTSGVDVRTNGNAQYFARSSTHTDRELRFQQFSDGNAYFGTQGLSGAITSHLVIRTGADSGSNAGQVQISPAGTQRVTVSGSLGVGIGNGAVTPSSYLTLGAGTATAGTAPIKLTSGTLTTSAVAGQYEYNGNHFVTNSALLRMPLGGTIFDFFTNTSVGGAEADIYSTTTLANTFNGNGDKVTATYAGNFVTVGTELTQLKVYFAGTAIWDSTGVAPTTGTTSWNVDVSMIRVSSTVVRYTVTLNTTGASGFVYTNVGELTGLTLSGTNILKITGTSSGVGSGAGDIIGKMGYGELVPAK